MASPRVCSQCGRDYIDCECFGVFRPVRDRKLPSNCPQTECGVDGGESASLSFSHNSDVGGKPSQPDLPFKLTGSQAKTQYALELNAAEMIREAGVEACVFITITCGKKVDGLFVCEPSHDVASKRINNASRRLFPDLFEKWIIVTERHENGGVHFHLLAVVKGRPDVRSGFIFAAVKERRWTNASEPLRAVWAVLDARLPDLGFGRAQTTPIEKTAEAVACYVSKYVCKNLFARLDVDKGKKLVRYGGFSRHIKANDFGWCNARATAWRKKAEELASMAGVESGQAGREEVAEVFGSRWAFRLTRVMHAIDDRPLPAFEWTSPHERECARQFVLRVASTRWVLKRAIRNSESPVEWCPDWEAINEARYAQVAPCLNIV